MEAAELTAQAASAVVTTASAISRGVGIAFSEFVGNVVPMLMFAGWILGQWWMLVQAQKNDPTFRAVDFLRDEPKERPAPGGSGPTGRGFFTAC